MDFRSPTLLTLPLRALAFLGRYGAQAFALSLLLGFALPQLAAPVRPMLGVIIFTFITVNMMRADLPALRKLAARPLTLVLGTLWNVFLPAAVIGLMLAVFGRDAFGPGLLLGLAIAAAAPPLVAAPAYAMLLGFSNALPLAMLVLGMVLTPLTAPLLADAVAGAAVPLDRWALMLRLAIFLFGAMAAGLLLRRIAGEAFLSARKLELDGVGVVLFFIFAIALAESVGTAIRIEPLKAALFGVIALGLFTVAMALTLLVWWRSGAEDALTLGLATSLRNTGLLIAVLGVNDVPPDTFLFFALLQFPIYFAPQLVKPLANWARRRQAV